MRLVDVLAEALAALGGKPSRTILSVLGTAVGVASLVATVGIARTASGQVTDQLRELAATSLTVAPRGDLPDDQVVELPTDTPERIERLSGTVAAATRSEVPSMRRATAVPAQIAQPSDARPLTVLAASDGLGDVVNGVTSTGRFFDSGHDQRGDHVGVLGRAAAQRLGIHDLAHGPALAVDDLTVTVIGILEEAPGDPELLSALIVPDGLIRERYHREGIDRVAVRTEPGAAPMVARQVRDALVPVDPTALEVTITPGVPGVESDVEAELNVMMLLLGGTALLAGAFGITNLALVSVMERAAEIGLRRALGAQRHHIGLQFLSEAGGVGMLGGACGCALGLAAIAAVSAARGWAPVLDAWLPTAAVAGGVLVGLLAGAYPALRASKVEPAEAVRR